MDVSPWGQLTPEEVRRRVRRGSPLTLPVESAVDMSEVSGVARALRAALPDDLHVIASPGGPGGGPRLVVLRLVAEAEAVRLRGDLDRLVTEFRHRAGALVARLHATADSAGHDGEVEEFGATWTADEHGEHCRFENVVTGEVVEASVDDPDAVDPYFLLLFAQTSHRHNAVHTACVEGFHDMVRLLDLAGVTRSR
ncbi:hypothetical protein [Saccharothrix hoggarensis]|uniref:Uncharacterized protein n=1 Tax=Saccharothrix hoggarensis TaxID=913853 RepID=A0ABW3QXR8_9PSEU